jgi:NTE family protein
LFAIGVRGEVADAEDSRPEREPSLAQVMGILFDVIFLDHLTADIEHLERLNRLLSSGQITQSRQEGCERMRPLQYLLITPSVHLSQVASHHQREMPYLIQYFVNSLGRDASSCADLMSYLLFTPSYTSDLIDIGYRDAEKRIDEIEHFLFSSEPQARRIYTLPQAHEPPRRSSASALSRPS